MVTSPPKSPCLSLPHQGEGEQKPLNSIPAVGGIVPLSVGAIDSASAPAAVKEADEVTAVASQYLYLTALNGLRRTAT